MNLLDGELDVLPEAELVLVSLVNSRWIPTPTIPRMANPPTDKAMIFVLRLIPDSGAGYQVPEEVAMPPAGDRVGESAGGVAARLGILGMNLFHDASGAGYQVPAGVGIPPDGR